MRPNVPQRGFAAIGLMRGRLVTCGGLAIRLVLYRKKIGPIDNRPQVTNQPHKKTSMCQVEQNRRTAQRSRTLVVQAFVPVWFVKRFFPIYSPGGRGGIPYPTSERFLGSAALETLMVLPFLLVLLLGTVEIPTILYTYSTLHQMLYSLAPYLATQPGTTTPYPRRTN